jgi:hypothetical protein
VPVSGCWREASTLGVEGGAPVGVCPAHGCAVGGGGRWGGDPCRSVGERGGRARHSGVGRGGAEIGDGQWGTCRSDGERWG